MAQNSANIQDLNMENEVNLCASCRNELPECPSESIIFGTGVGYDNICACSDYEPIESRNPNRSGPGNY